MYIINYKNFYKKYDQEILFYSQKINPTEYDDIAQYIRMYIWKHLWKFDFTEKLYMKRQSNISLKKVFIV